MEMNIFSNESEKDYYYNGVSFLKASERCLGDKDENSGYRIFENRDLVQLPAPAVVNAAFAAEMFFKALLRHFNCKIPKGANGHNLECLYKELPKNIQDFIGNNCMGKNNITGFEKFLNDHARDFIDIRYYIEEQGFASMSPLSMYALSFNLMNETKYILDEVPYKGDQDEN